MLTELISRYRTIGHEILDLETELGVSTEPHKETLDRLIEEARAGITVKDSYTKEDAVGILRTIDSILRESFSIKADLSAQLLSLGLKEKVLDCDNISFIYLSIADALKLPLAAVPAPKHLFVRFILDLERINWETTSAEELSDSYYTNWLNISPLAINNGVYLRDLTRQETMAHVYNNRGNAWARKGNLDKAIEDCDKAIRLNPNYAEAYTNRGVAWSDKGNLDKAIADHDEAIRLNPNLAEAYNNRGNDWRGKGNLDTAIADYDEAIRLNPNLAEAYYNRGVAWRGKGNLDKAIADYDEAIRLNPNFAEAYNNRGVAWAGKGNLDKAIADYDKAIRLNPNLAAAYNNRGNDWAKKGDTTRANADFTMYDALLKR